MKKLEKEELVISFEEGLTKEQFIAVVKFAIEEFVEDKDEIPGYRFSPIRAEIEFYNALAQLTVKDFSAQIFDRMFELGMHKELESQVVGAKDAHELYLKIVEKISSISNIIDINLQHLGEQINKKFPNEKAMKNLIWGLGKQIDKLKKEDTE